MGNTQLTAAQYDNLIAAISAQLIQGYDENGDELYMDMMGECYDTAKIIVDNWANQNNIELL